MQRDAVLSRLERRAARSLWPRATMLGLVTLTGLAGSLISDALLRLHLTILWLRYGLSAGVAYRFFLVLVGYWARLYHRPDRRRTVVDGAAPWYTAALIVGAPEATSIGGFVRHLR